MFLTKDRFNYYDKTRILIDKLGGVLVTMEFNLDKVLNELGMSYYRLGVESKIRPASIGSLAKGEMRRIDVLMINKILNELNKVAKEKGIKKQYTIEDIIKYTR